MHSLNQTTGLWVLPGSFPKWAAHTHPPNQAPSLKHLVGEETPCLILVPGFHRGPLGSQRWAGPGRSTACSVPSHRPNSTAQFLPDQHGQDVCRMVLPNHRFCSCLPCRCSRGLRLVSMPSSASTSSPPREKKQKVPTPPSRMPSQPHSSHA